MITQTQTQMEQKIVIPVAYSCADDGNKIIDKEHMLEVFERESCRNWKRNYKMVTISTHVKETHVIKGEGFSIPRPFFVVQLRDIGGSELALFFDNKEQVKKLEKELKKAKKFLKELEK